MTAVPEPAAQAGAWPRAPGFGGPAPDRLAIAELNHAYSHAITAHDIAAFRTLWIAQSTWSHPIAGTCEGLDAIAALIEQAFAAFPMVVMTSTPGWLAVTGETARGLVYIDELVRAAGNEPAYRTKGYYEDEYVRRDGTWLFVRRAYTLLHEGADT